MPFIQTGKFSATCSISYVDIFDEKIIDLLIAKFFSHDSENLVYTVNFSKLVLFFFFFKK